MKDDAWVLDLPWIPVRSILFRCYGLDLGIILSTLAGTSYLFVSAIHLSNLTQIPVEFPLHTLCGRIYPSALHLDRYNYLCWQLTGEGTFPKKEESAFLLFC